MRFDTMITYGKENGLSRPFLIEGMGGEGKENRMRDYKSLVCLDL